MYIISYILPKYNIFSKIYDNSLIFHHSRVMGFTLIFYKINEILKYVRRTNPEMTRDKLIEELGKCEYSARALIFGFQNVSDGSTRI